MPQFSREQVKLGHYHILRSRLRFFGEFLLKSVQLWPERAVLCSLASCQITFKEVASICRLGIQLAVCSYGVSTGPPMTSRWFRMA
jgi:hypothetical protein